MVLVTCSIFFVSQVKSFIETQRALLSEIQNGCKRNFILAKEKEETEQKMRQSASMAEIATEDGTGEEEEEPASEEQGDKVGKKEEEGTIGSEGHTSSQSGASSETSVPQMILESDSDTEDEEEEEVITKSSNSSHRSNQTAPQTQTGVAQPPLSASHTSPSASPTVGQSVISGITVTESTVPPGTPPSPGRCISVSSPGRGHKIFMVTRVESPPEQQQLQLQMNARAAPSQAKEASKKPLDSSTQQTEPPPASQTQLSSPAPSTDCHLPEQSPVAHVELALNTTHTHHTLEPQSEDVTASTLDPEVTNPSPQPPALPLSSSPVQAVAFQLTEEVTESTKSPQPEPTCVYQQPAEDEKEEEEQKEGLLEKEKHVMAPESTEGECKQPSACALEQLQNDLASASEETQILNQTKEDGEVLPQQEKEETPASLSEKPLTEEDDSKPNQEEPSLKPNGEQQESEPDEEDVVQPFLSVQTDEQAQGGAQEPNPPAGEASKSPDPASFPASTGSEAAAGSNSPFEEEESPDESSADEGECFAEALIGVQEEEEVVSSALPNGLKPEFSLHLLDPESPKPGSCVMEHGESL